VIHIPSLIERKRDGAELSTEELVEFIRGYTTGEIPDYQASAWAMAVYFRGMTTAETRALTRAMIESGRVFTYPADSPPKVDKHSTGGVGDKVSLVLAPLLACDCLWVPMISGRALGITGGTLDKLESIPSFDVAISEEQAGAQLAKIGVFMIGQTDAICPADRKLYALRDVTATVPSQPLIVSSIMSKKLAEHLDRLVLDVKFGCGAFMKTRKEAELLGAALTALGQEFGLETTHLLTPMEEPLGRTVGNALEVDEAVATLQGHGPADLVTLILDLGEKVATASRVQLARWLEDGTAWRKFVGLVEAQHGDSRALERITDIHRAPLLHRVAASRAGRVTRMDAGMIGRACVALGAGRTRATDSIDFAVGCADIQKVGAKVDRGESLFTIHARDQSSLTAALPLFEQAVELTSE
jgi:pyrimidine-nucleoside phosphorylase